MSNRESTSVDAYVGRRMKDKREEKGLSQETLAKDLGISFQQVQKYERGFNRVGASRLLQIANILEVPIEYFFDGLQAKNKEYQSDIAALLSIDGCIPLLELYASFSAKLRKNVLLLLRTLRLLFLEEKIR